LGRVSRSFRTVRGVIGPPPKVDNGARKVDNVATIG
jgi:hypothetical protein